MYEEFEARRMARRRFVRRNLGWIAPLGLAAGLGIFFGLGHLVEWLWRVTLVDIFAIRAISFWQAWGLILLSQILFKANIQPTMRTGHWRHRNLAGGDTPGTKPEGERT
jgi:hypothetical protein